MLKETYYSKGKNDFKDGCFNSKEWSAPIMVSVDEIKKHLDSFKLEGRRIQDIRFVSHVYNLIRDSIEDYVYGRLKNLDDESRQRQSDYESIDPEFAFSCFAEIDEPLLIRFDDNDQFEIDTPQEPEFSMSMNCIPWYIKPGCNASNMEASILFQECIGKKVLATEIKTYKTNKNPMYFTEFEDGTEKELVETIIIWLEDGLGLFMAPCIDYCHVWLADKNQEMRTIPFAELKRGLFNWEDIHEDDVIGFRSESGSFLVGEIGKKHAGSDTIVFIPENNQHEMRMCEDDLMLFFWSASIVLGSLYDQYEDYTFSYDQWNQLLEIAEKIVSSETFDEMFDYLISFHDVENRNFNLLYSINQNGAVFWKLLFKHKNEAKDLRKWTELVLKPDETMQVRGS